jgi:transposase
MAARFVNIDHATPLLLPPDLRDWVAPDHMVHFIMEAVDALDLSAAHINERGTGKAQYPPYMMLGLLIYCYSTGTFSSRRIETQTYENVAVRYLTADTHPDHDSICKFRRENKELLQKATRQSSLPASGRPARQRSIQLHRPRKPDYENARRLRTMLQRPGRR